MNQYILVWDNQSVVDLRWTYAFEMASDAMAAEYAARQLRHLRGCDCLALWHETEQGEYLVATLRRLEPKVQVWYEDGQTTRSF